MRTGGPRTQDTHPVILAPLLRITVFGGFVKSTFARATGPLGARASGPHVFSFHCYHAVALTTRPRSDSSLSAPFYLKAAL
jgi:hypothetical protein